MNKTSAEIIYIYLELSHLRCLPSQRNWRQFCWWFIMIKAIYSPHTMPASVVLTHWGRVTHICTSKLTIISSDNGLSPGRRQAIIWTNAGILLIRTLGTHFSEILGEIYSFSFSKMHLKITSAKWCLFDLGLNELSPSYIQGSARQNWQGETRLSIRTLSEDLLQ